MGVEHDALVIALAIEDITRQLDDVRAEQDKLISEILQLTQQYRELNNA